MKKLSFFLMAMLVSLTSFATEVSIDLSAQSYTNGQEITSVSLDDAVTVAFNKGTNNTTPKYYNTGKAVRVYGGGYFTITTTTGQLTKIELTFGTGEGSNEITVDAGSYATGTWTGQAETVKFTVGGTSGHRRIQKIAVTYGEVTADYVAAPSISGDVDFIESTEVSIAAGEGLKVYYTVDGNDPTNASAEYTVPFEVTTTTTVKAIAYNGENASEVASQTFTKATEVTCAEAKEIALKVSGNNVPTELTYVVKGYVTNIVGDWKSGKQSFWIADTKDGGKVFEAYFCFISKAVTLGDYVQLFGKLTKYNTTPEMADGQATILPAPVAKYNVTVTAENGTVTGAGEYEEGKEATLTATPAEGYEFTCWTSGEDTVSTANPYTFVVTADVALVANFKEVEDPVVELPAANVRAWAYDLALAVEGEQYTFSYKATTDAVATLIFTDANGIELATKELGVVKAGANTAVLAASELPAGSKLNWAIKLEAGAIAEVAEVTDQTRGIYDFYNMMDVLVDNNPESDYFGRIYIQMAYDGADDAATDRSAVQKAGFYLYDQALNELNPESNVSIRPTLPEGYTMGDHRNKFHRLDIDPKTGNLTWCYNVAGQPAVFAVDAANLAGEATNLVAGIEGISRTAAHCFDAEGALYVMDLPAAGTIYKIVNGVATVFAATDSKWVNASMTLAADGKGGLWVAQNRGQIDTYYQLAHYTKDGVLDYAVYQGSENGFTGSSARGALAYNAERQLLAQGRNGKVEVYSVAYDAETGVPALTLVATTPTVGNNIDGLHFDYAGDLYVVNSSKEKFQKFAMPTDNNVCTTPAAAKYAIKLVEEYTVKATVNPAETGVIAGLVEGGVYVKGAEATLTATAAEGYEFVNWTVADSVVSTETTYTFVVEANVELVANFKEAAIEYMVIEDNITNLVIDLESMAIMGGPSTMWQVEVYLGLAEDDNLDGQWSLSPESSVAIMGLDARFIDGYVYDIDVNAPAAKAVLHVEDNGSFYEIKLDMTSTPQEAIVVVVEDATVQIDTIPLFGDQVDYALKMTANWTYAEDGVTYPVLVEVPVYYPEATEPSEIPCTVTVGGEGANDPWLGFGEGTLTITTVDGVVTAKGIVANPYTGVAFDVTVSGKLPAAEPVKHTVTITVNPEGAGTVTGAGEYEDGAEVTVTAEENEGYIFLGWMEDGEFVAEDYEYTFTILNDVDLVAVYATQLLGVAEDLVITETALTATAILSTGTKLTVNLVLGEYDEEEGAYWLAETTTLTLGDKELTFLEGLVMVDTEQQTAIAAVLAEHEGVFYAFTLVLAAPASGVDNINTNVAPRKVIRDGQLIIIKNGVEYNVQGAILK